MADQQQQTPPPQKPGLWSLVQELVNYPRKPLPQPEDPNALPVVERPSLFRQSPDVVGSPQFATEVERVLRRGAPNRIGDTKFISQGITPTTLGINLRQKEPLGTVYGGGQIGDRKNDISIGSLGRGGVDVPILLHELSHAGGLTAPNRTWADENVNYLRSLWQDRPDYDLQERLLLLQVNTDPKEAAQYKVSNAFDQYRFGPQSAEQRAVIEFLTGPRRRQ
jgi:hypothetical protein